MNIPMRWGRTATRFAVCIWNRGRERAGYGLSLGSPDWWVDVARRAAWGIVATLGRMHRDAFRGTA